MSRNSFLMRSERVQDNRAVPDVPKPLRCPQDIAVALALSEA